MSYRNPQQVVDTQSGKAFADLQKTISGTFAGVADTYKKDQAAEAARLNKIAEKNRKAAEYYQKKEDQVTEGLAKLNAQNPALNIGEEFTAVIDRYSDIMGIIQSGAVTDAKTIAKLRAEAASILAMPDQVRTSIESFSASSIDLQTILEQKGKMGGYDLYSNPKMLTDLQVFLDQRPGQRKIKINNIDGAYSSSVNITGEDGETRNYPLSVLQNFLSGGSDMISTVPDQTSNLDNMSKMFVYDIDEDGKKTLKDNVLGTVASGPDGAGNTVTYKKVNKDAIEKSIQAEVKGNMAAMSNTGKVAFWNNILAEKDSRNNIKEGQVRAVADASTEEFNEEFFTAYSNYFLKRIPERLELSSVRTPTPKTKEGPIETGKDFYDKVRKNPISYLQAYTLAEPEYDRAKNTITIKAEDRQDDEDKVYNMNNPDERISFYTKLLEYSQAAKGDSTGAKLMRKQFEDAVRAGTSKKSKYRKQEATKKKEAIKKFQEQWNKNNPNKNKEDKAARFKRMMEAYRESRSSN